MCGISGGYLTQPFNISLAHRGPDGHKRWSDGVVTVDFWRLAITGEGVAPFENKRWAVWMNGEIYNHKELGHVCASGCDTEAVLKEFTISGVAPERFNGMFAIVAYDKQTRDLWLIRDRFGIKPIYYDRSGRFGSELSMWRGIARPNVKAWAQWMAFQNILTDETYFEGVTLLGAGEMVNLRTGRRMTWHDWPVPFRGRSVSFDVAVGHVCERLRAAIDRQRYTGAVGFLSGGVDSGLIATHTRCDTITARFEPEIDESTDAARIALAQHHIEPLMADLAPEWMERLRHILIDPRAGPSWSNLALYTRLRRMGVRVAYEGCGADEFNMGYTWRYDAPDYWAVVNRTGIDSEYLRDTFKTAFPTDTLADRVRFDIDHFMQGVLLVTDQISMSQGIETRVPFLDNDLCDYLWGLPPEYLRGKRILKAAAIRLGLPVWVTKRPKRGFTSGDGLGMTREDAARKWCNFATWNA
jgi:asparagine synthase (glutamine-hydrolysing)